MSVQDAHRRAWGLPDGPTADVMNVTEMAVASENLNALVGQMQVRAAPTHYCYHFCNGYLRQAHSAHWGEGVRRPKPEILVPVRARTEWLRPAVVGQSK